MHKPTTSGLISLLITLSLTAVPSYGQDAAGNKQQVAENVHNWGQTLWMPLIIKRLVTLNLSQPWWDRVLSSDSEATNGLVYLARDINYFGKNMGWGDLEEMETNYQGSKDELKPKLEEALNDWASKLTVEIDATDPKCDTNQFTIGLKYVSSLAETLGQGYWKPSSGAAHIKLIIDPNAKAIKVSSDTSKKAFTIVTPANFEPTAWAYQIPEGLKRVSNPI